MPSPRYFCPMPDLKNELADAAQSGNLDAVRRLLGDDTGWVNVPLEGGLTALHYAAYFGHAELAGYLLSIGADPAAATMDPLRATALHAAAGGGHAGVVEALLGAGADPNALQTGNWTALHTAADRGKAGVIAPLLAAGADPGIQSASGKTALMLAQEKGHASVVAALAAPGTA